MNGSFEKVKRFYTLGNYKNIPSELPPVYQVADLSGIDTESAFISVDFENYNLWSIAETTNKNKNVDNNNIQENKPLEEDSKDEYPNGKSGWKFHISISEEDLEKGWNIVKYVLISNRIRSFKVCKNGLDMACIDTLKENIKNRKLNIHDQRGKQITIYSYLDVTKNSKDWQKIFEKITGLFVKYGVKPSYSPPSDLKINGSSYIYYRYDDSEGDLEQYNKQKKSSIPENIKDPYQSTINLSSITQQTIPAWEPSIPPDMKINLKI